MQKVFTYNLTSSLVKAFAFAIGIVVLFLFMRTVISTVLLFVLAVVFAIIINAPVNWLEKRRVPRGWATLIVLLLVFVVFGLLSWLIIPVVSAQFKSLIANLPVYVANIEKMVSSWRAEYFSWIKEPTHQHGVASNLPSISNTLWKLGGYSISLLGSVLLFLVLISLTAYMVIYPRPLLRFYLSLFPRNQREKAESAFVKTSFMLIGWMRANLIGGTIQGISVIVFLSIMNVPGAWVWGVVAFISQMIPKIGFFLMSIPPTLVALSISPMTALWVFAFFLAIDEILGDFIMPRLRSSSMNLHPVTIIFFLLVMGSAFGFIGILLSTPMAAFVKSFYEEFYLSKLKTDVKMEQRIDAMINKSKPKAAVESVPQRQAT
jgi:predicted PurR-regulated permease PerM